MVEKSSEGSRRREAAGDARPVDLGRLRTRSLFERKDLVTTDQFGRATDEADGISAFLAGLPDVLAARGLRELARAICSARRQGKPVVMAMGAHVIKCGLGPFVIDLMERGYVSAIAMNGAGPVHDFEIACKGSTSEDVAAELGEGEFGMARETAEAMASAAEGSAKDESGLGRAVGRMINQRRLPHREMSVLAAAARLELPATVHVAIGTDIVHMHPTVSAAAIAEASHLDFRILCDVVSRLDGGVWLNVGSAVVLPEVFLKALTVARNLGHRVEDFTAGDMDMLRHYRPEKNVLSRPGGRAYSITGHHEIMLPLLRMAVLVEDAEGGSDKG